MKKFILIFITFTLAFTSCDLDLSNPNAATEDQVLSSKDGLIALALGIRQVYSTSALGSVILTPSVTTRETGIMTTFANLEELEEGGAKLSGENGYTSRLFSRLVRVKGMAEDLIDNVDNVQLTNETKVGLRSYGQLFRAMRIAQLAHNFTHVPLKNSRDNNAAYVTREEAYAESIALLRDAISSLENTEVANSEFDAGMNILNVSRLFLARYLVMTGQYEDAITAANAVDQSDVSYFNYDSQNRNPVFENMFLGTVSYAPRSLFGLPEGLQPDPNDLRIAYFMTDIDSLSLNNLPIELMSAPFFNGQEASIPIFRPGEVELIIAESHARMNQIGQAENAINKLISKNAADDALGIAAGLDGDYSSGNNQAALLDEIYKQRRIELFLIGTSLEDSRRFNRPEPLVETDFNAERSRNYYPFPLDESLNNPNTPANPSI